LEDAIGLSVEKLRDDDDDNDDDNDHDDDDPNNSLNTLSYM
jgi:hypothetical protein